MKINIYYGGRGVLDDPTLYVLDKMEEVLVELRVNVDRYNIYEHKSSISTLPQTMKDADGIILATTVEWLGIGGYMQQLRKSNSSTDEIFSTAFENASLSTASALPDGTAHSLAIFSNLQPSKSSSSFKSPDAVHGSHDLSELEHTSSARSSVLCAPVVF